MFPMEPNPLILNCSPRILDKRIEEANQNPSFPRHVMEFIHKNKPKAEDPGDPVYTEIIETLLSIPWGIIPKRGITSEEFKESLNRSHYGLQKPKEIICDLLRDARHFKKEEGKGRQGTGIALLLVGPPGVGKTSLSVSIAHSLAIPYRKFALGAMKDEKDLCGCFTPKGSKPGAIVQGLIQMGVMNGAFIFLEADKVKECVLPPLLELLDLKQNRHFYDEFIQSALDLSNCHFFLTANTIETVPAALLSRCKVIMLSRYSVEEKISIARRHLIPRVREKYMLDEGIVFPDPEGKADLMRFLVRRYTCDAGLKDLDRILRKLFLRVHRKEILAGGERSVTIDRERIEEYLQEPTLHQRFNEDDEVGEIMALGVDMETGGGSTIAIQATEMNFAREGYDGKHGRMSILHVVGNGEKGLEEIRKVATGALFHSLEQLGLHVKRMDQPVHLHFRGAFGRKDRPSLGGAIALALSSFFLNRKIRRDVAMTGEIDLRGRVTAVGGLDLKLETAYAAGCKTLIIPGENLHGPEGIERLSGSLKQELQILDYNQWKGQHEPFDSARHVMQVVAVDHIVQAADIAFINQEEIDALETAFVTHARNALRAQAAHESQTPRLLYVLHMIDSDEWDARALPSGFCSEDRGFVLLVGEKRKHALEAKLSGRKGRFSIRPFDPRYETLTEVVRSLRAPLLDASFSPLRISLLAPLRVLKRDGIREESFPEDSRFAGLRVFAGGCTAENIQIKECGLILNRTLRHLERLPTSSLEECPFLVRKEGIHLVSLSFIPEKYRLDPLRCEEILQRGLNRWLAIMEGEREEG